MQNIRDAEYKKQLQVPRYLIALSMIYLTAFMFPMMMAFRLVHIGVLSLPGGTVIFPASYFFGDIIAEIYGYEVARQVIWAAIACQLLLGVLIELVLHLPAPAGWSLGYAFSAVLGQAFRYAVASSVGNFFGEFINIYLISKFKVLLSGKYFWLRSFLSTCFGEAVLTVIVFVVTFGGITSVNMMIQLIIGGYIFKCIFGLFAAFPASWLVSLLKKNERLDIYDTGINFNPFKFAIF